MDQKWNTTTSAYDNHRQYVTPFLDQNLSMTEVSSGDDYYFNQDGLGSVRNVVNSSGTVQNTYKYTSFGEAYGTPTEAVANRYQYTGREKFVESGNLFYRNRGGYNPGIGRFSNRNPWGYIQGRHGLYDYVDNDPVNWAEPFSTKEKKGPNSGKFIIRYDDVKYKSADAKKALRSGGKGFEVQYDPKGDAEKPCCPPENIVLVQAVDTSGMWKGESSHIDIQPKEREKNKTTKGGVPLPAYIKHNKRTGPHHTVKMPSFEDLPHHGLYDSPQLPHPCSVKLTHL